MQNFLLRTASVAAITLASLSMQAQAVNCGATLGSAGTLAATGSTTIAPGSPIAPPSITGYTAGLPNREYALFNPNDLVYNGDSTIVGGRFLAANLTGSFNPSTYGLGAGDQVCMYYISYDRTVIRNAVDELLNGSFLFTPCCALIPTFVPDLGDVCSLLNAAGITGPSSVNNLNDVFNVVNALGGSPSLESLLATIDVEINPLIASGTPCTGGDELCYTVSNAVCYDIVAPGCSTASAPTGQAHTVLSNRVQLNWVPQAGAVACQVNGKRVPTGPQPSVNVTGAVINTTNVPFAVAGAGTTWTWRVRCACTITPLAVSPYTAYGDTFSIPAAREASMLELNPTLFPNPAADQLTIQLNAAQDQESTLTVLDLMGRVIESRVISVAAGVQSINLDVTSYSNGMYFVRIGEAEAMTFEVVK